MTGQVTVCLQVFSVTCLSVRSSAWSQIRIKIRYYSWVSLILNFSYVVYQTNCGVRGHPSSMLKFSLFPPSPMPRPLENRIRVQAIVGTGGHFLIRLGSQNERDGQRDRGPEDGTMVQGV